MMRRRSFLTALAFTPLGAGSGCLSRTQGQAARGMHLGWYAVANHDTESHHFGLRVERDGEQVHRSSHEVQGRDENDIHGAVADCTWDDTAGDYSVFARVDGGEWVAESLSGTESGQEMTCGIVEAKYRHGDVDGLTFWTQNTCTNVRQYDGGCEFAEATTKTRTDYHGQ